MTFVPHITEKAEHALANLRREQATRTFRVVNAARNLAQNPRTPVYEVALRARVEELDEITALIDRRLTHGQPVGRPASTST